MTRNGRRHSSSSTDISVSSLPIKPNSYHGVERGDECSQASAPVRERASFLSVRPIPKKSLMRARSLPPVQASGRFRRSSNALATRKSMPELAAASRNVDVAGIMKVKTLDESLHSSRHSISDTSGSSHSVSFNNIQIREYKRALGDNPSVSCGPPITLSWEYKEEHVLPVETYEANRIPRHNSEVGFALQRDQRERLLLDSGCSRREMVSVVRNVNRTKHKRRTTVNNLGKFTAVEEVFESAFRKFKRHVLRTEKKLNYDNYVEWQKEANRANQAILEENMAATAVMDDEDTGAGGEEEDTEAPTIDAEDNNIDDSEFKDEAAAFGSSPPPATCAASEAMVDMKGLEFDSNETRKAIVAYEE